ncbi:PAS domain S-box protein [Dechloromonas sp. ZY10]|uniref:PAS domain S-box protein n=1 Tax=Dechloromonas aquae TaxID=2664436 RepID=UPI0035298106
MKLLFVCILVAGNLFMFASQFWMLILARERAEQRALAQTRNLTQTIQHGLEAQFDRYEKILRVSAKLFAERGQLSVPGQMGVELLRQQLPEGVFLLATDARGRLLTGERSLLNEIGGLSRFRLLELDAQSGMQVFPPSHEPSSRSQHVTLALPYRQPGGAFGGFVFIVLPDDFFDAMLGQLQLGENGVVTIRDASLALVARYPRKTHGVELAYGSRLSDQPVVDIVHDEILNGSFNLAASYDGVARVYSFGKFLHVPLIIFAGLARQDFLAEWQAECLRSLALGVGFLMLSVFAGLGLLRLLNELGRESDKNSLFLRHASDGLYILDRHGYLQEASESFAHMLGDARENILGKHVSAWNPEWPPAVLTEAILPGFLNLRIPCTFVTTYVYRGRSIPVEASVVSFEQEGERCLYVAVRDISQRLYWEQDRSRLVAIVESSEDGMLSCDAKGEINTWNQAAANIFGLSREAVQGLPFVNFFSGAAREALLKALNRVSEGGLVERLELSFYREQYGEMRLALTLVPLPIPKQEHSGVSICVRDVTELRASEKLLRLRSAALEATDTPLLIATLDGEVVWANPAYRELFPLDVQRRLPEFAYWENNEPVFYHRLRQQLCHGESWSGERQGRRLRGEPCYEEVSMRPVSDADGVFRYLVVVKRDVSVRKRAQAELEAKVLARSVALQVAEERTRLILDCSAGGLYGVGKDGCLLFVNRSAASMLGRDAGAMVGHSLGYLAVVKNPSSPLLQLPPVALVERQSGREEFFRSDGSFFTASYATEPLSANGEVLGVVVSFMDVSREVEAAEALEAARTEAERLSRAKSEFLANMSHEIRTPMNGVLGAAQLGFRQSPPGGAAARQFSRILTSGQLLLGIINDILDLSKIEAGKMLLERLPMSLAQVGRSALALFGEQLDQKGLGLILNIFPDAEIVCEGDPLRVTQIINNLLSNAIKFTASGEIRVQLDWRQGQAVIRVEDSGIGMSEEQLARLFTPFEQADSATTRRYGGTGLGLSITRNLLTMMGGGIKAESSSGRGSCFECWFPAPASEQNPATVPDAQLALPEGAALAGLRILVVDDTEVNRLVLEEMLQEEGALVSLAASGEEAVALIRQFPGVQVVLMDVQMPGMDGCAATREIHRVQPSLPVIAQTAHAMQEERLRCFAAGMCDLVVKPVDYRQLVRRLAKYLPANAPGVASAESTPDLVVTQVDGGGRGGLDWDGLQERYATKPVFVERLLRVVLDAHRETPGKLRQSAQLEDWESLSRTAHGLKGTLGTIFAFPLMEQARVLEVLSCEQSVSAFMLAGEMAEQLDSLCREISAFLLQREAENAIQ